MRYAHNRITVIRTDSPKSGDINELLQWFGTSIGLFSLRDKDKSGYRIWIELMKAGKARKELSSDELAEKLGLTRGTIVHHLNKLIEAGIVTVRRNKYSMRRENLTFLIDELEKDSKRIFGDLRDAAVNLDRMLGL